MKLPLVSVLMPIYKEPIDQIIKSTQSVLTQSYKNIELIVIVDNPKNYKAINYLIKIAKCNPKIRIEINSKNEGIVSSLNKAFNLSKGKLIARMDADDISVRNRLALEINFMIDNGLDLVASNVQSISQNGNILHGKVTNYPTRDKFIKKYLRYYNCLPHPTWLVKREMFDNLSGYRDIPTCEDYDLLIRGAFLDYKYGLISEPLLYYRENQNSISKKNDRLQKAVSEFIRRKYRTRENYTVKNVHEKVLNKFKLNSEYSNFRQSPYVNNSFMTISLLYSRIKGKVLRNIIMLEENISK